jgi:acyl carrier protein
MVMETKFIKVIKDALEMEDKNLAMDDKFKEYEEWDSLAQLTLIAELDENFDVTIQTSDFKNITTLQELFDHIQNQK